MKKTIVLLLCLCFALFLHAQQWGGTPVTVDATNFPGPYNSMTIVNGNPAISYYIQQGGNLGYVRASDISGSTWPGTPVTVDASSGNLGTNTSLAVVNGNPAISYDDLINGTLKYVRASDVSGSAWNTPLTLEASIGGFHYSSLLVVNGNPAISYYDGTNTALKYIRATDASGTTWGTILTVDNTASVGEYTSMAVVNSNPAVSYLDGTNSSLKYVRATDASGTTWGTPVTVDNSTFVGGFTVMAVVNGNPAISYYDAFSSALRYVRATDASGTTWGTPVTVDNAEFDGRWSSLLVVSGNPAISYEGGTNLKYARASDASGSAWDTPVVVEAVDGQYSSLLVVNGLPAISYYDASNFILKYSRSTFSTGLPVELVFFKGTNCLQGSCLTWQTATELNNEGFEIQKAAGNAALEAGRWQVLAFVEGNGSTTEVQNYAYTDQRPQAGLNYYRLKQIDFDGKFEYSDVVSLQFAAGSGQMEVFPNPVAKGELTVYLPDPDPEASGLGQKSTIRFYDQKGRMAFRQTTSSQQERVNVSQLTEGVYFMEVTVGRKVFRKKVVVE